MNLGQEWFNSQWFMMRGVTEPPALRKLEALSHYPRGWAHGDGDEFSCHVVGSARYALTIAASLGLDRTDVFPRRDGGVVVSVYIDKDVHDFTLHADGRVEWLHECDDVEIDCQPMTLEELGQKLVEIARTRWHSYGYWWQPITAHTRDDSKVPLLANQLMDPYLALTGIVQMPRLVGPVST
jgi:hypothetical protein